MVDYFPNKMANIVLQKVTQKASFLPPSAIDTEIFCHSSDLLADAVHIYASIPFNATHTLTVQITAIPFSIPLYCNQIFYCVDAFYAKCCYDISEEDFMPCLFTAGEELYRHYMRHHSWNFRTQHAWRQIQVPEQVRHTSSTCLQRSSSLLKHLIPEHGTQNCKELHPIHFQNEINPKSGLHESSISNATLIPCPGSTSTQIQNECPTITTRYPGGLSKGQLKNEHGILEVAKEFLRNLSNTSVAGIATDLVGSLCKTDAVGENGNELAIRAFECYVSMARQSMTQLKHSCFTRYVSLCFFLIWEKYACKAGKAGARVINIQMRESGFTGSSRNLKALRDETIFINRLVASVESMHDIGIASLVLFHIFESSNYHRIRLMNRYGEAKKRLAIWQICANLNANAPPKTGLPTLQIQKLIQESMPALCLTDINKAIRYSAVDLISTSNIDHVSQSSDENWKASDMYS
ncbi:hypothetical protein P3342_006952 [Pyrenophora teres f. teres]|nr:hypothetical protein P3342_006952 [Pyrenophora teres f. teres]